MRIFYIAAVFVWFSMVVNGQAPEWEWAKRVKGSSENYASSRAISMDKNGNVYVTGYSSKSALLGNDTVDGGFIAKYDSAGNLLWLNTVGSHLDGVAIDGSGDIYTAGAFSGSILIMGDDTLTNYGYENAFVIKYDPSGYAIWARCLPETGGANIFNSYSSISTDDSGNVYGIGSFQSAQIILGVDTLINTNYLNHSIFIIKYNSTGNVLWAKGATGIAQSQADIALGISVGRNGNVYATGTFSTSDIIFDQDTLPNPSYQNVFIVKYDASGRTIWAKGTKGTFVGAGGICNDADNNSYITGYYSGGSLIIGNDTTTDSVINSSTAMFIAKINPSGNTVWIESIAGIEFVSDNGLAIDGQNNIYATGSTILVNPPGAIIGKDTLIDTIKSQHSDIVIIKYDSAGNMIWVKGAVGIYTTQGVYTHGIGVDDNGTVYIAGQFSDTAFFDDIVLTDSSIIDFFIAKLTTPVSSGLPPLYFTVGSITIYPNPTTGKVYFSGVQTGYTLQVYNVLGEIISSSTVDRDNYAINLSGKAKGMYFYRVADGAVLVGQGKVVVE